MLKIQPGLQTLLNLAQKYLRICDVDQKVTKHEVPFCFSLRIM